MSNLPMHILLSLHQWTETGQDGSVEVRKELGLRETKEAPTPDELEYQDEYLDYPISQKELSAARIAR